MLAAAGLVGATAPTTASAAPRVAGAAAGATTGAAATGAAALAGRAASLAPGTSRSLGALATTTPGRDPGYWLVASDGGVYGFGVGSLGQLRPTHLDEPIVGAASTPDGGGYWLVAADGGIFSFGDARFYGSTGGVRLDRPIVGMAATADGRGYWLVASDGGIFSFGDATFHGSTGGIRLDKPVVAMAATGDGRGYWLVASDGGIFCFGDATFHGSTGGVALARPVVGMSPTATGSGYWLVATDGGIFAFGDADFDGSTGGVALARPIVSMAPAPDGGYWLVASDGGIFAFGGAPFLGSTGEHPGPAPIVAIARTPDAVAYQAGSIGSDVSFPQCANPARDLQLPPADGRVSVVGVNDGLSDSDNPCFAAEAANAGPYLTVYLDTDADQPTTSQAMVGPKGTCVLGDLVCSGYNWGYNNATASVAYVHREGFEPTLWWLDVEQPCGYSGSRPPLWLCGVAGQRSNAAVVQGALDAIHHDGYVAGIYSTYLQWPATTGGYAGDDAVRYPGQPIWIAWDPADPAEANVGYWSSICGNPAYAFAGGIPWLVQWGGGYSPPTAPLDGDYACPE